MYFQNFPKIYYDFPQDDTSTTLQILTDITTNVRIRKEVLESITIYDEYDIEEGETPEIIAEKVYGNPEYHWIIMLANQRYDYLKDFPMSSVELDEHIRDTYGVDNVNAIHHYEKNNIIVEGRATLKVPSSSIASLKVHDFMNTGNANARIESVNSQSNTVNLLMDYGRFSAGDTVFVKGVRLNEDITENVFRTVVQFVVPSNGFTLTEGYEPITNYIHEVRLNESKRRIKLISKNLVDQIVREFKALVKPL
jgi:hypothetical protein